MNSALTRSAWVCSGNRRPAPSAAGSSGLRPAAIASGSPGRIRTTLAIAAPAAPGPPVPASRAAISRYSALAGSTTSHGIPAAVAASSSARTVCDFPDPVAPLTNTCRFSESSGSVSGPAGRRFRSRISPTVIAARPGAVSWVTSKSGRSGSRMPGISRSGGRAQRGDQLAARAERVGRHRVAAGRAAPPRPDRPAPPAGRGPRWLTPPGALVGGDRVGQAGQVGGGAHQAGHPGGGLGVGAAREQPDPPHARRDALAHLAVPQAQPARRRGAPGKPVRIAGGVLLPLRQFLGQLSDLGRAQRFGDEQPAERTRPRGQQALLQRGGAAPVRAALVTGEQPVAYPADGPPRGQPCHQPGQRAAPQRPGSRSAGQGQEHLPALVAADQARARGEELDRAVRVVPDPADGHRAGAVALSAPVPGGPAWYAATRAASRWMRPGSSDSAGAGAGPGSGRRGISVIR